MIWLISLLTLTLLPACATSAGSGSGATPKTKPAQETGTPDSKAMAITFGRSEFSDPEVIVRKSMPPQFVVIFDRDMPTPQWKFELDGVDVAPETGRIVAKITELPPEGFVSQVISPHKCRIDVGTVAKGKYVMELWVRRGKNGSHRLAQAFVLNAH